MTIVCGADGGLDPHGFTATTPTVYEPGGAGALTDRAVVARLPTNEPDTMRT